MRSIKIIEAFWCDKFNTAIQDPKSYRAILDRIYTADIDLECRKHRDYLQGRSRSKGYLLSISSDHFYCSCDSFKFSRGEPCKHLLALVIRYQRHFKCS